MADERRYFQFLAGPRRGEVLIMDRIESEDGDVYITFKDDSRMNETLIAQVNQKVVTDKMMAEIDSPTNCWRFQEKAEEDSKPRLEKDAQTGEVYEIPNVDDMVHADLTGETGVVRPRKKNKLIELVPPRTTPPNHSVFGAIKSSYNTPAPVIDNPVQNAKVQQAQFNAQPQANTGDPVWLMCNSSKKFDTEVNLTLTISLPKKSFYNVVKESFEDGGDKVVEYIIQNLDNQKIKDSLKKALKMAYDDAPVVDTWAPTSPTDMFVPETVEEAVVGGPVAVEGTFQEVK
jgi:hypothetical protein